MKVPVFLAIVVAVLGMAGYLWLILHDNIEHYKRHAICSRACAPYYGDVKYGTCFCDTTIKLPESK